MDYKKLKLDFLILGGQRCGTTWIYSKLNEHPDVFMPSVKEIHFFNVENNYRKGLDYYRTFFETNSTHQLLGEATPDYLCHEKCPERIHEIFPEIRFIVLLRDPVDRAYSAFWMFRDYFGNIPFEQAIKKYQDLIRCGEYSEHITKWCQYFPMKQFLFLLFDDLNVDEQNVLDTIFKFLKLKSLSIKIDTLIFEK
jgi:hypothetical protein